MGEYQDIHWCDECHGWVFDCRHDPVDEVRVCHDLLDSLGIAPDPRLDYRISVLVAEVIRA